MSSKYFKVSETMLNALKQLVEGLPYGQVKGVAIGFEMPEHVSELPEEAAAAEAEVIEG